MNIREQNALKLENLTTTQKAEVLRKYKDTQIQKRFTIKKYAGLYIIMDEKKRYTCLRNKRFTDTRFKSIEAAEGYLVGMGRSTACTYSQRASS